MIKIGVMALGIVCMAAAGAAQAQDNGDLSQAGKEIASEANSVTARAMGQGVGQKWDSDTVETLEGVVTEVESIKSRLGVTESLHIYVQTDTETLPVVLGPQRYLGTQNTKINQGDQVKITGSRVIDDNRPVIIASEVRKGDQTLRLRDRNGKPLWSGKGGRNQ